MKFRAAAFKFISLHPKLHLIAANRKRTQNIVCASKHILTNYS